VPEAGTADAGGCWSGCARIVDGRPALYYTGVDGAGAESVCRAWGTEDLRSWRKDARNPLIPGRPGPHRDPFLWRDAGGWHLLLGSERRVLRYDSPDATEWRYGGVFFEAPRHLGGLDLGEVWECPQLLETGGGAVLVVSCQVPGARWPLMHAVAFLGALRDGRFEGALAGPLDHGDVFYAPALMTDAFGRALLWGWAQEREPPGTISHAGALTLPRELLVAGDRVLTWPVPELEALRRERLGRAGSQVELAGAFRGRAGSAGWTLGDARVSVDFDRHRLAVVAHRRMTAPLPPADEHSVRVFLDGSLLEIFADDGRAAITTRCYAEAARPELRADDGVDVVGSAAWRLSPP
jgi:beta-fructofuranosidase